MYTVIWQYDVAPDRASEFEAFYGSAGPWVDLFRRADGFVETLLLRGVETPGRYITLDRWETAAAYARFQSDRRDEYATIDASATSLTSAERCLGSFES